MISSSTIAVFAKDRKHVIDQTEAVLFPDISGQFGAEVLVYEHRVTRFEVRQNGETLLGCAPGADRDYDPLTWEGFFPSGGVLRYFGQE